MPPAPVGDLIAEDAGDTLEDALEGAIQIVQVYARTMTRSSPVSLVSYSVSAS
ncbi:MAG: hypothetical protein HXY39_10585 [Chloroflexi bacterium]|nr:hypothetical protein [Chloroflexota bacterium]